MLVKIQYLMIIIIMIIIQCMKPDRHPHVTEAGHWWSACTFITSMGDFQPKPSRRNLCPLGHGLTKERSATVGHAPKGSHILTWLRSVSDRFIVVEKKQMYMIQLCSWTKAITFSTWIRSRDCAGYTYDFFETRKNMKPYCMFSLVLALRAGVKNYISHKSCG